MARKISLSAILVIQCTMQVLGITGVIGYLSYSNGKTAIEKLVVQLTEQTDKLIIQELDHYLSLPHQLNAEHLAAVSSGAISPKNLDQLHQYLIGQHWSNPNITTILFGDTAGNFRTIHRVEPLELEAQLTNLQRDDLPFEAGKSDTQNPSSLNLFALKPSGELDRQIQTINNIDVRDRVWYQQALKTQQPGFTEPFQIGSSNVLAINAFTPLLDENQNLQGVFSVNVSLNQYNEFLESIEAEGQGEIFIIDRSGLLVADSTRDTPYLFFTVTDQQSKNTPGKITFKRLLAQEHPNPIIHKTAHQLIAQWGNFNAIPPNTKIHVEIDGHKQVVDVIPYHHPKGLDWVVVSITPESAFLQTLKRREIKPWPYAFLP
ncbi:MAG: hypothetical protein HC796_07990 [Synechococcaceae cyanobacterium RL_1_2]|nr:hypothetical protein [Synechococcaceae cyanobacterium RL_1_2]